jgi:hypothetical protein
MLRYTHTAYLVSIFQGVSKPQFLRTLLCSLIHSLCGPAHGIQTKNTDWLYTIRYVYTANDEVRMWSYSIGTCVGLRKTQNSWLYIILHSFPHPHIP